MDTQIERTQLQVPERNLKTLTFCSADAQSLNQWLQALPRTNLPDCAKKLGFALKELAKLNMTSKELFGLVELIRPVVYFITHQINRNELTEGIVHSEQQISLLGKCQQLHLLLFSCYKSVVDIHIKNSDDSALMAAPVHRAIAESHSLLLLMQEHYREMPATVWLDTHKLVHIAGENDMLQCSFDDPLTAKARELTIIDQYKRMLLLSHCRSNQLHQSEIRQVNKALCLWAPHGRLLDQPDQNCWFMVNTLSDEGLHHTLTETSNEHPGLKGMDTRVLSAHLKKVASSIDENKPATLSKNLVLHLASAWGALTQRQHIRHEGSESCSFAYGSSASHYYLSDKQTFDDLVKKHSDSHKSGKSGFIPDKSDIWEDVHDVDQETGASEDKASLDFEATPTGSPLYPCFSGKVLNTSAGGYCLQVRANPDITLVPGELIAVQEGTQTNWILASARWVHSIDDNNIMLGAQLLSANTKPCAITPLKKTRDASHYQRAFLQPAMPALNSQATLITPRIPFTAGMKFILLEGGKIIKGQLLECIESTPSYSQYQFRFLDSSL
ncbi:hypothetical protein [Endozoicomonas lisbonensis]|uniref:GTPase n=1 Tax=Endozoicomonas lisbonensis TaxID=3120522 RepID=A0ABV2SH54_9GAMM